MCVKSALVLLLSLTPAADALMRLAVLPVTPEDQTPLREGLAVSYKLVDRLEGHGDVFAVDLDELRGFLRSRGLKPSDLTSPATARAIGRLVSAEGVLIGSIVSRSDKFLARVRVVHVPSGRVSMERTWEVERDIVVGPPPQSVDAPVLSEGLVAGPCDLAPDRIDALERSILDLKARYWALQLLRGINWRAIKYNPGSTITDPRLKREFYERIRKWQAQDIIPQLAPIEIKSFAEIDEQVMRLARQCGIL